MITCKDCEIEKMCPACANNLAYYEEAFDNAYGD